MAPAPAVEMFQADIRAASDGGQRFGTNPRGQAGLLADKAVDSAQQGATAGQHQPVIDQIRGQVGAARVERVLDGVDNLQQRRGQAPRGLPRS